MKNKLFDVGPIPVVVTIFLNYSQADLTPMVESMCCKFDIMRFPANMDMFDLLLTWTCCKCSGPHA